MTHRGPFQPLLFCDSVNSVHLSQVKWPNSSLPSVSSSGIAGIKIHPYQTCNKNNLSEEAHPSKVTTERAGPGRKSTLTITCTWQGLLLFLNAVKDV